MEIRRRKRHGYFLRTLLKILPTAMTGKTTVVSERYPLYIVACYRCLISYSYEVVEAIVSHKITYRVKWCRSTISGRKLKDTWEPEENLE